MKCHYFELVVWLSVVFLKYGFTQECRFTHTIQSNGFTAINISIQELPTCFMCPVITEDFTLNLQSIMNVPPHVEIKNSTLIIHDWSAVPLTSNNINNILVCNDTRRLKSYTTFFNLQVGSYVAPVCGVNNMIGSTSIPPHLPIDVNITNPPACFTCPEPASSFMLNDKSLTNSPPDVVINSTTLIIYNWTAVPLTLSGINGIACIHADDKLRQTTIFYSLTPGPLTLLHTKSSYMEGEGNISVICVNPNMRSGYDTQNALWKNSSGHVVGEQRNLTLSTTRNNAGIYTCSIPSVPLIPSTTFEVVIIPKDQNSIATTNPTTSSLVNPNTVTTIVKPNRRTTRSDYVSTIVIAIIVSLLSILLIGIIVVVVLILLFRRRAKIEHLSKTPTNLSSNPGNIPVTRGTSVQYSRIGDYDMVNLNQNEKGRNMKEVEALDSYKKLDKSNNNMMTLDSGGLYSIVDKDFMDPGYDEDIPDLYSVVSNTKSKEADNDHEEPDLYSEIDMSQKNVKSKNPTSVTDLYAVVDKSKKKTKTHGEVSPDDISAMYAVVDKTKKKKEEDEEKTDPNILDLYDVVDKSKKTKNRECDEHTPDLSEMYAVVDKSKKTKPNHDDLPSDEPDMYAVVNKRN